MVGFFLFAIAAYFRREKAIVYLNLFFIALGVFVGYTNSLEWYEKKFFRCEKIVDMPDHYLYECYMRETTTSEWKGPIQFDDATLMFYKKYDRSLY